MILKEKYKHKANHECVIGTYDYDALKKVEKFLLKRKTKTLRNLMTLDKNLRIKIKTEDGEIVSVETILE